MLKSSGHSISIISMVLGKMGTFSRGKRHLDDCKWDLAIHVYENNEIGFGKSVGQTFGQGK